VAELVAGYMDCMEEALRYLQEVEEYPEEHPAVQGLRSHLDRSRQKLMDQALMLQAWGLTIVLLWFTYYNKRLISLWITYTVRLYLRVWLYIPRRGQPSLCRYHNRMYYIIIIIINYIYSIIFFSLSFSRGCVIQSCEALLLLSLNEMALKKKNQSYLNPV